MKKKVIRKTPKLLHNYKNGNADIKIYEDGTRVCHTEDDDFNFEYPLNMDIKVGNRCFKGCACCHEKSTPDGDNAPLENFEFLKSWLPGCEVAYGGGSVTENPVFGDILAFTKECGLIANTTFHIEEFIEHIDEIVEWQTKGMLYGIGVSWPMNGKPVDKGKLVEALKRTKNVVFHVIVGIVSRNDMEEIIEVSRLANKPAKVLLLGFKNFGRGKNIFSKAIQNKIDDFANNYDEMVKGLNVISFDNLALGQLSMKERLSPEDWEMFYQGNEGTSNMYIDAVKGEYALCSIAEDRYPLTNDIKDMFKHIKETQ